MPVTSFLSPPAIAKRYGVDPHKVLSWIKRGELHAIDVAGQTGGRPRYRISQEAIAQFEARRSAEPSPKITRVRRQRDQLVEEFF
jgi:transposase